MIPIGIITRNRAQFLDVTLRSISATNIPKDQTIIIFDDASDNQITTKYLYTNEKINLDYTWPNNKYWEKTGLNTIYSQNGFGISEKIRVIRFSEKPMGVVKLSCHALQFLERNFRKSPIILLQDDIVFTINWYQKLTSISISDAGLICGCNLGRNNYQNNLQSSGFTGVQKVQNSTAQCFLFTRKCLENIRNWFSNPPALQKEFDYKCIDEIYKSGLSVYLLSPGICQHFGITSLVRPDRQWNFPHGNYHPCNHFGRVDPFTERPFVIGDNILKSI